MAARFEFTDSNHTELLLNPRLPAEAQKSFQKLEPELQKYPGHYWLLSSGSSSANQQSAKVIGLSRKAFRASAEAVNRHLKVTTDDVWGLVLPHYHVGGLSIFARAEASASKVVDLTAMLAQKSFAQVAMEFCLKLNATNVTLLSLVPTQIFDLVDQEIPAPPGLRAVVVGGASLSKDLYRKARSLGWPLLPSFGMTEVCSQIATAELDSLNDNSDPGLRILEHCQVETRNEGEIPDLLVLRSQSLLTGYFQRQRDQFLFHDPKIQGALHTRDRVRLQGTHWLEPLGRATDFVKVNGEGVDLESVRTRFFEDWSLPDQQKATIVDVPDPRSGAKLYLVIQKDVSLSLLEQSQRLQAWNVSAFPPERIIAMQSVADLPRTALGKISWEQLRQVVLNSNQ